METAARFRTVVEYLADGFSCGQNSISREDVVEDGVMLANEIAAVLGDQGFAKAARGRTKDALEALAVIQSVWESGYDLASGYDFANDGETVSAVICELADGFERKARPAVV